MRYLSPKPSAACPSQASCQHTSAARVNKAVRCSRAVCKFRTPSRPCRVLSAFDAVWRETVRRQSVPLLDVPDVFLNSSPDVTPDQASLTYARAILWRGGQSKISDYNLCVHLSTRRPDLTTRIHHSCLNRRTDLQPERCFKCLR